jgi:hypothetical protein
MNQIKKLLVITFSAFSLLYSCSGNTNSNALKDNTSSSTSSTENSSANSNGNASFSCMLDGKEFSGSGTDQNINAAFHLKGDDKGQIFFRFSDLNNPEEKLNFQVAAKEGSTTFNVTPTYSYMGYTTKGYINYLDNPLTVTITSLTATRVSGTFSGTYILSKGSADSNAKQTIEVTDGKFDIPFSASADWKKMYNAE